MRTRTALVAVVIGGTVVLGALVAVPALANPGNGPGNGPGFGPGPVAAMPHRGGICPRGNAVPSGTLTSEQRATLAYSAEEEKLAHDLYTAFADRHDATVFDRIALSESRHLNAVRTMLDRYGIADPTAGQAPGSFTTPAVQATYDSLLAKGQSSERAALEVGVTVETDDIDMLRSALDGLTAPDVRRVHTMLLTASEHHRTAFTAWLGK
jgi:hypothetical protein